MIEPDKRKAVYLLHHEGMSLREISCRLRISRNTVRRIIKERGAMPRSIRRDKVQIDRDLLERLYVECDGWKQRLHEKLVEEEGIEVKYSTLTRLLRELGIGRARKERCERVPDKPGAEMQHDTTVYTVSLGGQRAKVIASLIYLRYSKRRYLKFYRSFNRFKMKCFFHEALTFWGYTTPVCVIDNTNLARLRGTGKDAVIVPEMAAFSNLYGFRFLCHEKGHANRKAGEERSFWTVETNFFPGRTFESLEDLNRQALAWATERMEERPQGKGRLIPARAFEHEANFLEKLLPHLPAPYRVHKRFTDQYGYVSFDGNFYWVPGTDRAELTVLEYSACVKLYEGRACLIEYRLPADGVTNTLFIPRGQPPPRHRPNNRKKPTAEEEKRLRAMAEEVSAYLDFALAPGGIQRHHFVRELFRLMQQMSASLFVKAVARALKYRITSIETIRRIAYLYLDQREETLPSVEVDESFRQREAYREGHLTDAPDFSTYDDLLEEDHG
jgi:transposase